MNELKHIKEDIEKLTPSQHIIIGKLLYNANINMFENKNGVFVNLTELEDSVLNSIRDKLKDIQEQEKHFINLENKKQAYKDNLLTKVNELCE